CPTRGVELHGQRDDLEHHGEREHHDAYPDEACDVEEDAKHEEDHPGVRAETGRRDERATNLGGYITSGVLDRMARLVTSHRCGSHASAVVYILREPQHVA